MTGPVEWAVLSFVVAIALGCMGIAWSARGIVARYELRLLKFEDEVKLSLVQIHNEIEDRNFLLKYDLAINDLTKDVRHTKKAIEQHAVIFHELHDDLIRAQEEVKRLGKIVNGNH